MSTRTPRHLPALDGIRGIAIGLVLVGHMWRGPYVPGLSEVAAAGGYGVDVFFALSGFLITGILLRSRGRTDYYWNFYVRRFLRIIPLYWGYLTLIFAPRAIVEVLNPEVTSNLGPAWTYYLFVSNLWFAAHATFTDSLVNFSWSLCIEEQFYLAFPFIVAVLPRRALVIGLVVIALLSAPVRYFTFDEANAVWTYVFTPVRCDGLAMGALAAVAWFEGGEAAHRLVSWSKRLVLPLTAIIALLWAYGVVGVSHQALSWTHAVVAAWSTCLIGLSLGLPADHRLVRSLSWSPLVYVGQISYALYLLHTAAHLVVGLGFSGLGVPEATAGIGWGLLHLLAGTAVGIGMATLSWRTIEEPILQLKSRWAPSSVSAVQ